LPAIVKLRRPGYPRVYIGAGVQQYLAILGEKTRILVVNPLGRRIACINAVLPRVVLAFYVGAFGQQRQARRPVILVAARISRRFASSI